MLKLAVSILVLFLAGAIGQTTENPCNEAALIGFVVGLGDLQCGLDFQALQTPPVPMAALDGICTAECAGAVVDYLRAPPCSNTGNESITLANEITARFLELFCQPVENADISRCIYALDATIFNNSDILTCLAFSPQMPVCSPTCTTALQRVSDGIGCCYQSIYNNSLILESLASPEQTLEGARITQDELNFLQFLGSPELWNACGVEIIDKCTALPLPPPVTEAETPDSAIGLVSTSMVIAVSTIMAVLS